MGRQLLLNRTFKLPPAVIALLLQIAAFTLVLFTNHFFVLKLPLIILACFCGLIAAGLSYWVKLAKWWWIIQGLFTPALVTTLALHIQPVFFLAAFLILVLVFWNTFNTQVPLYLSSDKVWQALERFLPPPNVDKRFTFMDIGSGLGGVLTHLANSRPDGEFNGVESAPLPFLWSWVRIR